jgi:tetratricopeptide (TPR) repeat protein
MNCSAPGAVIVKARASLHALVYTASMLCAVPASAQEMEEIEDTAGRIQYAWFTGEARELESALTEMEALETDATLRGLRAYYLAYGRWRLAQLYAHAATEGSSASARSQASSAAQACARHAQEAVVADARNADAYAIQAICPAYAMTFAGALRGGRREGRPSCRTGALRTANSLEPGNPRVLLIDRLCMGEPASADEMRKVVEAFESAPPRTSRAPDWGHAEALALLGQSYLTSGDALAARDALERALVIAPDYREAQELLQTAAVRPR